LSGDRHQPEDDSGQPGGLAGFAGLVPAAGALGFALVAAAGPPGDEVAGEGDLEGQVGCEVAEALRGKASGVADAAADSVAGAGEGDPGGVYSGVAGGVADQGADGLVAAEHGVDLLADH